VDKQGPSIGRIAAMAIFTLGCFGLLLFLWLAFGGTIPLQPKQYEIHASFPEATTLAEQADVRIAGVNVGKVRKKELDKGGNATRVTLTIEPKYAPLSEDTKAVLRQKTLLGETYVELAPGSSTAPKIEDGEEIEPGLIDETVELDEILQIFDKDTKQAFRAWIKDTALITRDGGGKDLNAALGNLSGFATDGADVLGVLDKQKQALSLLVRNTGQVFGALNERSGQLRALIENSHNVFSATAETQDALAETFQILPTFQDESRLTLERLERFSVNTRPLVLDLKPVADDLAPTIQDVSALAPDLEQLFVDLRKVIPTAVRDLPEGQRFLRGAAPVLEALHPFLQELNPILSFANFDQTVLAGFVTNGSLAFNIDLDKAGEAEDGIFDYVLQQFGVINNTSLSINRTRPPYDIGNAYIEPNENARAIRLGIRESFDCKTRGGEQREPDPADKLSPCYVKPPSLFSKRLYPLVQSGVAPNVPSPGASNPAGTEPANP
jgi:phospholipid/cholesterol/gamma-HCH transport system substrate-binding protein